MPDLGKLREKQGKDIQRMFSGIAPNYDFLNRLLSARIDVSWREKTVRLAPPPIEGPLLDVCTGTGDLALAYLRKHPGRKIFGTDFCRPMLEQALKKSSWKTASAVEFLEADTLALPFPENQFALISVAFGLRNTQDPILALQEMHRVARPGGRLAILEFSMPNWPVAGPLYRWYFRTVLPKVGQWFSKSSDAAYDYLPQSVRDFPQDEALADWIRQAGWQSVEFRPFTLGIATLYTALKPSGTV